jgi:hypothetical protein
MYSEWIIVICADGASWYLFCGMDRFDLRVLTPSQSAEFVLYSIHPRPLVGGFAHASTKEKPDDKAIAEERARRRTIELQQLMAIETGIGGHAVADVAAGGGDFDAEGVDEFGLGEAITW